jgi:serine/threonine-protein kinase
MLTGKAPFAGRDFASLMYQHLNTAPPAPSRLVTTLPPAFDTVVATALTKDRAARFAHAGELAAAARNALEMPSGQRHAPTRAPRASPPADLAAAGGPVDRPVTRAGPGRPATGRAAPPPVAPWRPPPPRYAPVALAPPAPPPRSAAPRVTAAALGLPAALLVGLMCLAGTVTELADCSTVKSSCATGSLALFGLFAAAAGFVLSIAGLTAVGRRTGRRVRIAWALLGAALVLVIVAAALS